LDNQLEFSYSEPGPYRSKFSPSEISQNFFFFKNPSNAYVPDFAQPHLQIHHLLILSLSSQPKNICIAPCDCAQSKQVIHSTADQLSLSGAVGLDECLSAGHCFSKDLKDGQAFVLISTVFWMPFQH